MTTIRGEPARLGSGLGEEDLRAAGGTGFSTHLPSLFLAWMGPCHRGRPWGVRVWKVHDTRHRVGRKHHNFYGDIALVQRVTLHVFSYVRNRHSVRQSQDDLGSREEGMCAVPLPLRVPCYCSFVLHKLCELRPWPWPCRDWAAVSPGRFWMEGGAEGVVVTGFSWARLRV